MGRSADATFLAGLASGEIAPVVLAQITFKSQTMYAWTGPNSIVWNGNTYLGVGKLGTISDINEGTEIRADGTSVSLNGIDNDILSECLEDVQLGAPAKLWFGNFVPGTQVFIGEPYLYFSGLVDQPTVTPGLETSTITIALENQMINHARASQWRYTAPDQHALGYPDDTSMNSVERNNDSVWYWGT
jgi:hypothetical protein